MTAVITGAAGKIGSALVARLPADTPARPDTLYGVSKVFGEALGRYHADRNGMQVACLRIGTFAPVPPDVWTLSNWLSPDDCGRLVDVCLRSTPLSGHDIVWGISANTRRSSSLEEGYALGYRPRDGAEDYASDLPATGVVPVGRVRRRRLHLARVRHRRSGGALVILAAHQPASTVIIWRDMGGQPRNDHGLEVAAEVRQCAP